MCATFSSCCVLFSDCVSECESFLTHVHVFHMLMCQASRLNGPVTVNFFDGFPTEQRPPQGRPGVRGRSEARAVVSGSFQAEQPPGEPQAQTRRIGEGPPVSLVLHVTLITLALENVS